jgi:hypothetical protein
MIGERLSIQRREDQRDDGACKKVAISGGVPPSITGAPDKSLAGNGELIQPLHSWALRRGARHPSDSVREKEHSVRWQ